MPVLDPDQDVGLALEVEHLACGRALELSVQREEQQVPDLLLVEFLDY
ncbi:hypothetical protein ACFPH6_33615 [Streptomyces xiangluensis]|uniref:Uncharacterized protein n=1 Tax=Streptomyces xiangluensis TaxID=2665720 RepID=A0ABV8YVY4_9ACTN